MKRKALLFLIILAFGLPLVTRAQEFLNLYANDGYYYVDYMPIQGSKVNNSDLKCEYIIPASDLAAMSGKNIYAMDFYTFMSAYNNWGNARFQVFMKEVEELEFPASDPSFYGTEGATVVYNGPLDPTSDIMTVTFSNAYAYGGGNLLVGFYLTQTGTSMSAYFYAKSTSSYAATTYPAYQGSNGTYYRRYYLPKTSFVYASEPVAYPRPRNLAEVGLTANSATIKWTNGGSETAWQLVYSDDATFNPDEATPVAVTTKPYTITNLTMGTDYYIYLRADYGDGHYSAWSEMLSVEPTCFIPNNLHTTEVLPTAATLAWTAGNNETSWQIAYSSNPNFDPDEAEKIDVSQKSYTLTGLTPEVTYYAYVRANCGSSQYSDWSTVCSFTPTNAISFLAVDGSNTNDYVPAYLWFVSSFNVRSQFIIPATNLAEAVNGEIKKLTFFINSPYSSVSWAGTDFKVYLMESENTEFSGTTIIPWTDMTEVYSGNLNVNNNEMEVILPSTFEYKGGNLVVGFNQTTTAGESANPSWLGQTTSTSCALYGYNSVNNAVSFLPKTKIAYFPSSAICHNPLNPEISDVTSSTATISWTPGGEETAWQVQYKKTADTDWNEPVAVSGTPSYSFNNLVSNTTYQARVRTNCGDDNYSDWVESDNFTTDCGFVALPYSHNFDDDATGHVAPTCWHFSDGQYLRIYESASMAHSGSNLLLMQRSSNESACYVALPAINTTDNPINSLKLSFWARMWSSTSSYMYLSIGVMSDLDDINTYHFITSVSVRNSYSMHEIYFDDYEGEGEYIVFRCYNTSNYYCIDDIEISVAPTCRQPLDLSSNYTSAHEANIRWQTRDLRQCNYQVSYSTTDNFDPDNGTIVDAVFENTLVNAGTDYRYYNLTCLNANTTYYFYVRANCGNGDYSEWSDDYARLTTGEACDKPDFAWISVKNTYVKFEWYGDIDTEWDFQYKESSSEDWITPSDFVATPGYELYLAYTLHGLTPGTAYDARLRRHCGMYSCPEVDDGYSDWEEESFTTYDGCWDGDPWMCTSHLGTQATVRWLNNGPDMRWQIRYRLSDEDYTNENIVMTGVLPEASLQQYTLTGLEPNSTYYWEVRGYCGENDQSDWSDEDYFFTRSTDGYITVDKAHPYYEDFENGMPEDWSRMNLYNYDMEHYDAWECVYANSNAGESFSASMCISSCRENMSWASDGSMILMPAIHIDENAKSAVLSFWSKDAFNANDARGTKMIWVNDNYLSTEYTAFDLGGIYQKSSKAGYWRKCFVNLDDFIGQTIIIAFDYVVSHNYNNYDWWVDNVCVQVFDKVGGGGNVTSGNWNNGDFWGGSTPGPDDDVIINANVNIPDGVVAEANQIVINTDTINTGGKAQKFGKLTIADGGQLKVRTSVEATLQKTVTASEAKTSNKWYAISSSVNNIAIEDFVQGTHNVYQFDEPTVYWQEYRNDDNAFEHLTNGRGYLYRSTVANTEFTGDINVGEVSCPLSYASTDNRFKGFNLIGNPYPHNIYKGVNAAIPNTWLEDGFYTLTESGAWSAGTDNTTAIKPNTGILVQAKSNANGQDLIFTDTDHQGPSAKSGDDNIIFTVKNSEYSDVAYVLFKEGRGLNKIEHRNTDIPMVYVINDGEDFAIADMNDNTKLINLGFEAKTIGQYTISVKAEGDFSYLHLVDKLTGNDIDMLVDDTYTFIGTPGDRLDRFVLRLEYNGGSSTDSGTFVYQSGNDIVVSGDGELQVFDVTGRIIATQQIHGVGTWRAASLQTGVYILKLNGMTQKIVVR